MLQGVTAAQSPRLVLAESVLTVTSGIPGTPRVPRAPWPSWWQMNTWMVSRLVQAAMHLCCGCGEAPQPSDNLPHAVPQILHFEPSLDAQSLRSDVIAPMKILSSFQHSGVVRWQECDYKRPPKRKPG